MLANLREILTGYRAGKAVYGIIIALAIVISLETNPPDALEAEMTILLGALAVVIAEFYSDYLQRRIDRRGELTTAEMKQIGSHVGTVMFGALLPIPIFLLATFGVLSVASAFTIIKWMLVGLLFIYGYISCLISGVGITWSLILGSLVGSIGLVVVLAKAALSH